MSYRGQHRAPSTAGKTAAKFVLAGGVGALGFTAVPAISPLASPARAGILDEIARCESGGNSRAQNPGSTASGTYQFLDSTWRSLGGTGRAKDASPALQQRMAEKLLASRGTQPWNASKSCWSGRSGAPSLAGRDDTAPKKTKTQHKAAAPRKATPRHQSATAPRHAARSDTAPRHTAPRNSAKRDGTYVVQGGDWLSSIAAERGTTWRALAAANPTIANPNLIYPGQVLRLPR